VRKVRGRLVAVIACLMVSSACGAVPQAQTIERVRLERAVAASRASGRYRMRGVVSAGAAFVVSWDGLVADGDERYVVLSQGVRIEHRRIHGVHWYRRIHPMGVWQRTAPDRPISLDVLLRGDVVDGGGGDGSSVVVRVPADVDALETLGHVPSVGPTTVTVHLRGGVVSELDLAFGGGARAQILLWDYGSPARVEVPTT
jgi:hypothetical protein